MYKKLNFSKINKKYILILGILLLLFLLFKKIFLVSILVVSSFFISYVMSNIRIKSIGLELVTLSAVITGKIYGPLMGLIVAFILIIFHFMISGILGVFMLWVVPTYCIVGVFAGIFPINDIVNLGIYLSIFLNIVYLSFTLIFSPGRISKLLPYSITNVIINVILFSTIGKLIVGFIG
jgi:hypothetical protein